MIKSVQKRNIKNIYKKLMVKENSKKQRKLFHSRIKKKQEKANILAIFYMTFFLAIDCLSISRNFQHFFQNESMIRFPPDTVGISLTVVGWILRLFSMNFFVKVFNCIPFSSTKPLDLLIWHILQIISNSNYFRILVKTSLY